MNSLEWSLSISGAEVWPSSGLFALHSHLMKTHLQACTQLFKWAFALMEHNSLVCWFSTGQVPRRNLQKPLKKYTHTTLTTLTTLTKQLGVCYCVGMPLEITGFIE